MQCNGQIGVRVGLIILTMPGKSQDALTIHAFYQPRWSSCWQSAATLLTPWGSLGTNLSSQGTPGNNFLTQKHFK